MVNVIVVKVGGGLLEDKLNQDAFLQKFSEIASPKILVHGGGKEASDMLSDLGISPVFYQGRRITDEPTLKVVTMVYAGAINKTLVSSLQALGDNAIGLSGADGNLISARKRVNNKIDFGFVGDPVSVNTALISTLLDNGMTPVICPLTHDTKGQLLNTNADTIASVVSSSLSDRYHVSLRYCFEYNGVLEDKTNPDSIIHSLNVKSNTARQLKGEITDGMIPKVDNALKASQAGVGEVIICGIDTLNAPDKATVIYG